MVRETIQVRKRRSTGTTSRVERISDDDNTFYVLSCLDHGSQTTQSTFKDALAIAQNPQGWCSTCKQLYATDVGRREEKANFDHNEGVCDPDIGCGRQAGMTTLFGNLSAPRTEWIRLCKSCQDPEGRPRADLRNHFMSYEVRNREEWKENGGMNRRERERALSRQASHRHDQSRRRRQNDEVAILDELE